jgi:uncharacterized hydrophobic protein (TIGR00271 family)
MMLQVRVVSPAAQTAALASVLTAEAGISSLVVMPGAASRPAGDLITFDLSDVAANQVFGLLRERGLDADGTVSVQRVATTLTSNGHAGAGHGLGALRREVAPVWELVEAGIHDGEAYALSFYLLLAIAGLIGAAGILTNSQILIVGAMVVGPEYNAIIAVALGISDRQRRPVRAGLLALGWGFFGAVLITFLFGLVIRVSGLTPDRFLAGVRPVASLINSPDWFSVIVAILAGIVGVVSLTESRANALIGVFISVTTIPAAASIGVSVAYQEWQHAWGSLLQLLLNVVLLITVGAIGLRIQHRSWRRIEAGRG